MLYDLVTETVHVLNASAGLVWAACDGMTDLDALVEPIVEATGADRQLVVTDVQAGVDRLAEAGLVGRTDDPPEPEVPEHHAASGGSHSAVHAVLDDGVCFHCDDPGLLGEVDDLLGLADDRAVTIDLGLRTDGDGVVLHGQGTDRTYASRDAFLDALPTALNQIAAASSSCIALQAGCVRSPGGEVVLLPAVSGSGKTTLTAALVQAGWDYATDEAVGVREGTLVAVGYPKPLVLDARSREVLGLPPAPSANMSPSELRGEVQVLRGEVGPVGRVVLPRYEPGALTTLEDLEPSEAIVAVLEHALNLRRVGQPGLEALCQLAERVPVQRLVHGGATDAVTSIS